MTKLFRVCSARYLNAGDKLLNQIQEIVFKHFFDETIEWERVAPPEPFGKSEAEEASKYDAIIVGGGGLIFDRGDCEGSWQWNITKDGIEGISAPIFLFAVGYNQFRNQGSLSDQFSDEFNELVKKCEYVGLRNNGSIKHVKKYIKEEYYNKIRLQPCATTIISKVCRLEYPREDIIALNLSFDRKELRYDSDEIYERTIAGLFVLSNVMIENGYRIKVYSHGVGDGLLYDILLALGVKCELVDLEAKDDTEYKNILRHYSTPKLVVGARGHSQMIPFGCRTPILSVINHDKLQFFLDDIGHPEWGVDVRDDSFIDKLVATASDLLGIHEKIVEEIDMLQEQIYSITKENVLEIKRIVRLRKDK